MTDQHSTDLPPLTLYTLPKYHFPPYEGRPGLTYVVASAPRCGSNLLCTSLWRTGAMGAPMEYFNPWSVFVEMSTRLGSRSFQEYMTQLLRHRVSPNGVFAAKIHWDHLPFVTLANVLGVAPRRTLHPHHAPRPPGPGRLMGAGGPDQGLGLPRGRRGRSRRRVLVCPHSATAPHDRDRGARLAR